MKDHIKGAEFRKSPLRREAKREIQWALQQYEADMQLDSHELDEWFLYEEDEWPRCLLVDQPPKPVNSVEDDFALASSLRSSLLRDEYWRG